MFMVDMHYYEGERFLIVIDTAHPERNRIEKVSDDRFAEFLMKVLDTDTPVSELEGEIAA